MSLCTLRAPEGSNGASTSGLSRPILIVRYHGRIEAYAAYRNGNYEFQIDDEVCKAIDSGRIHARFDLDDGIPIGIILDDADIATQAG
jgi:hypothetical protein